MKNLKWFLTSVLGLLVFTGLFAETIDLVQDFKDFLNQYFMSAAAFSAAVMAVTGLLKDKIKLPTQWLSLAVGVLVGALGLGFKLGIFESASIWQAVIIVLTATLGTNGLFDLIFRGRGLKSGGGNPPGDKDE